MSKFFLRNYSPENSAIILNCDGPMPSMRIGQEWIARPESDVCTWLENSYDHWDTTCGVSVSQYYDPVLGYNFCPNCGRPIKLKEAK